MYEKGEWREKYERVVLIILLILSFIALGVGIGKLGLWDPWETTIAKHVSSLYNHTNPFSFKTLEELNIEYPPLKLWFLTLIFKLFGFKEIVSRVGMLLITYCVIILSFLYVRRVGGEKLGFYTALVLSTFPIIYLSSKQLFSNIIPILGYLLFTGSLMLIYCERITKPLYIVLHFIIATLGLTIGILSKGGILGGGVPVLGALIGCITLWAPSFKNKIKIITISYLLLLTVALGIWIVPKLFLEDGGSYSLAIGAKPTSTPLVTFEYYIEYICFATFPWIGFLFLGLSEAIYSPSLGEIETNKEWGRFLFILVTIGYLGYGLWTTLYEVQPIDFVFPLATMVGLVLREIEESREPNKAIAAIVIILWLLIVRDWLLYPDSITKVMTLKELKFPEGSKYTLWFGIKVILFGIAIYFLLAQGTKALKPYSYKTELNYIIGVIKGEKGSKSKAVLITIGIVIFLIILNGIGAYFGETVTPWQYIPFFIRRVSWWLALLIPISIIVYLGYKFVWNQFIKLESWKINLVIFTSIIGVFIVELYLIPLLTQNLSPKFIIEQYQRLNKERTPLGIYRFRKEIFELLGVKEVEEFISYTKLIEFLNQKERRFGVIPSTELALVDSNYRNVTGTHLNVLNKESKNILLISNKLGIGEEDYNPLSNYVLSREPSPMFKVKANLDNKIEYLGYDIISDRGKSYVGASEKFILRLYWHCIGKVPGSWKVFVHIDGYGMRLNGDHDPVKGLYLTQYWNIGDYIIDEHELRMPAHFPPGSYTIFTGFFQGSKRLPVIDGPKTPDNRIRGGVIIVK